MVLDRPTSMHRIAPLVFLFGATSASTDPNAVPLATYELGFSLNLTANNDQHYTLFIYKVHEGRVLESTAISEKTFVLQGLGLESSRANLSGVNLFEQFAITDCEVQKDELGKVIDHQCLPLDELWKLRYGGATSNTGTSGWAQEVNAPGVRQQIILQAYRSPHEEHWIGPYFGARAFALLHDIQDPQWIATYRDGR